MVAYEIDVVYTANDGKEEEFTHVVNTTDRDDDAVALTREYFDEEYPDVTDLRIKEVREVNRG
jgi:hypothetical protein